MKPHAWHAPGGADLEPLNVPGAVARDFALVLAQSVSDPSSPWCVVGSADEQTLACLIADEHMRAEFKAGRPCSTRIVMGAIGPDIFDGVTTPFGAKKNHEELGEVWP